jgi:hypothetical protein
LHDSTSNGFADWDAASPPEAAEWFATVSVPWWIAGGRAIDLFLGRDTRTHQDLDVGVLRRDVSEVLRSLPDWEIFEAKDGVLTPLHGDPRSAVNSLWCTRKGERSWKLELMLDESEGELWVYRRDSGVRRTLRDALKRSSSSGIPYLAPEIQLLYKAKHARPRDELDFKAVTPELSNEARRWLLQSLARTLPSHPWTHALERLGVT